MEYKCKVCGGELQFNPELGKLCCPYCGSEYDMADYEEHTHDHEHDHNDHHEHEQAKTVDIQPEEEFGEFEGRNAKEAGYVKATDDSTDIQEDLVVFSCPHCGAELVTDKDTIATKCVFCQTPMVIEKQTSGKFKPQMVIPFEVSKKQIGDLYEEYIKTKPFYPPEYSRANVIEKIKAIYLPFWLFDMKMSGYANAQGERTMTHTIGDWIVTDHFVYAVDRQGNQAFRKIPVIASSKTPKNAMDSLEPFDYSKLVAYNPGYLSGFLAQRYDLDEHKTGEISSQRASTTYEEALRSTMSGYQALRITRYDAKPLKENATYALLPTYLLFMDYDNDEDKLIAINGQTGKIVGNIPVDPAKRNRYFFTHAVLYLVIVEVLLFAAFMFIG